jgi:predicted amidohydrolase YtcJ
MLTDEVDPDSVPYSADQLNRLLRRIDARGWQIIARASGDRGVRMALDAFAHARRSNRDRRGERRHRLDGARFVTAPDLPRFDALGVLASLQPYHDPTPPFAGGARPIARPGPNPVPALAVAVGDEGGRIAFGSGWPAAPLNPLLGLGAALDGQPDADAVTASSRPAGLDLAAAIDAYTAAGAWASFDEQRKGSIEAGMLADIVILSDDIFDATSLEPSATHVSLTIFDGKVVYRRQGPTAE